jgi:hypothetical protein
LAHAGTRAKGTGNCEYGTKHSGIFISAGSRAAGGERFPAAALSGKEKKEEKADQEDHRFAGYPAGFKRRRVRDVEASVS